MQHSAAAQHDGDATRRAAGWGAWAGGRPITAGRSRSSGAASS